MDLDLEGVIYVLRNADEIDDVAAKILLTANEVKTTQLWEIDEEKLYIPRDSEKTRSQLKLIASFEEKYARKNCFDEAYRAFYQEMMKTDKKVFQ